MLCLGTSKIKSCFNRKSLDSDTSLWDMNFQGTWEMGQDLIGEFVNKQNKRNRSISESDANNFHRASGYLNNTFKNNLNNAETAKLMETDSKQIKLIGENDSCINEMEQTSLLPTQLLDDTIVHIDNNIDAENIARASDATDYMNIFKAKFDNNVKALWEDNVNNANTMEDFKLNINNSNVKNDENIREQHFYYSKLYPDSYMMKNQMPQNSYNFIQSGTNLTNSIWSENCTSLPMQDTAAASQQHQHIHESESLTKFWHEENKVNNVGDFQTKVSLENIFINIVY